MFPEPTETLLIGCLIESSWTPKSKSNTLKPKTNSPTYWPRDISHVRNGIICCVCQISAISVLQFVLKRWQKDYNKIQEKSDSQRNRDQWWAILQGRPRTYHPRRQKARAREPMEIKIPGVRKLREDRTEQPVMGSDPKTAFDYYHEQSTESSFSARYSKWDDNQAWSSQEWKSDTSMCDRTGQPVVTSWGKTRESQSSFFHEKTQHDGTALSIVNELTPRDRTGQPVVIPQRGARPQQLIIGNDETKLELSVKSRSFLNRVDDQVRKRQKRFSMNATENEEKHSMIWWMFLSVTFESAVFMEKNYLDNWHSITNTKDLTLKQMFDISSGLVSEQDEISGLETLGWKIIHGNTCLWLVKKESSIFNAQRSTSFRILYCVLGRSIRIRVR